MDGWTRRRAWAALAGIVAVTLCAGVVDLSGVSVAGFGYTLTLWRPVVLRQGLDLGGGVRVLLRAQSVGRRAPDDRAMGRDRRIILDRVGRGLDLAEPSVRTLAGAGRRYIAVEWAGSRADVPAVQDLVRRTGRLSIFALSGLPPHFAAHDCYGGPLPHPGIRDLTGRSARGYPVLATGKDIVPESVAVGVDTLKGSPVVDAALTPAAAARVRAYVAAKHPLFLGIAVDDKIYDIRLSAHLLPLGAQFQMTNTTGSICVVSLTATTVNLVTLLKYGALPAPLRAAGVQGVGPTVAPSSLAALELAGLALLVAAALALAIVYRLRGVLAAAALLVDLLVTLAVVKLAVPALTLAGLAGFALAVLVAADAQRAIARRAAVDRRSAIPVGIAAEGGATRAWPAARDSAAALLVACALLWWVGTAGAVSVLADFAATLFIGVAVSTATALAVSPALLHLAARPDTPGRAMPVRDARAAAGVAAGQATTEPGAPLSPAPGPR